jgi:hypothetical protein
LRGEDPNKSIVYENEKENTQDNLEREPTAVQKIMKEIEDEE